MEIVIVTGGTGGHIYPALSLADGLVKKNHHVTFIGSKNRMEASVIPQHGYAFKGYEIQRGNTSFFSKLKEIFQIGITFLKCIILFLKKRPHVVIGFGNYISVPVILAAKILGIQTIIHEQNIVPGKANLFLGKCVKKVVLSFEETKRYFKNKNVVVCGNPRETDAYHTPINKHLLMELGLKQEMPTVLIVMGSLGSASVSIILKEFAEAFDAENYQVIIVTGEKQYSDFPKVKNKNVCIVPYIDGLKVMRVCDVIVMRSGATTILEACALAKATITIPSPYVPNNHQKVNASYLVKKNATIMIEENDLTAQVLQEQIDALIGNPALRQSLGENAHALSHENALNHFISLIEENLQ